MIHLMLAQPPEFTALLHTCSKPSVGWKVGRMLSGVIDSFQLV